MHYSTFLDDGEFEVNSDGADHLNEEDILMFDSDHEMHPGGVIGGLDTDDENAFADDEGEERMEGDDEPVIEHNYREQAIQQIENMVLSFLSQISHADSYTTDGRDGADVGSDKDIQPKRKRGRGQPRKPKKIELKLANRRKRDPEGPVSLRTLSLPKSAKHGNAKTFAQLFKALDITHRALVEDIPTTKRDIFYQDVQLFEKQGVVDRLIDDVAATFHLERSDLNVRAASKGLVCGSALVIHLVEGECIQVNDVEGTLIPAGEAIETFSLTGEIDWVLIVEKEAIFQTLCRLRLTSHADLPGRGIMITGKGYPDVATRELVKTLETNLPESVPILALVDADAYGLDILSVYKYGSVAMRHENEKLAARRVEWLGVWGTELEELGIDKEGTLLLTEQDMKKAHAMLKREKLPKRWRAELVHMLQCGRKAEIEILYSLKGSRGDRGDPMQADLEGGFTDRGLPTGATAASSHGKHPLLVYLCQKIHHFASLPALGSNVT